MLTAWQYSALPATALEKPEDAVVVIPDFLTYARMLNTGQAATMLKLSGSLARAAGAGILASPAVMTNPLRTAKMDFWVIAESLLRYDLALVGKRFPGTILLHSYLADFAFTFNKRDFVSRFFKLAGTRAGIQTQQLSAALTSLARWDLAPTALSYLFAPSQGDNTSILYLAMQNPLFARTHMLPDITNYPRDVQRTWIRKPPAGCESISAFVSAPK